MVAEEETEQIEEEVDVILPGPPEREETQRKNKEEKGMNNLSGKKINFTRSEDSFEEATNLGAVYPTGLFLLRKLGQEISKKINEVLKEQNLEGDDVIATGEMREIDKYTMEVVVRLKKKMPKVRRIKRRPSNLI